MTAAEKILQKALVGSSINSSDWNRVQAALRDRAFFSSRIENLRILHKLRENVAKVADGLKSPSETRRDMRAWLDRLGYDPGDRAGTIGDLRTKARLDVILDVNARQARGFAQHLEATTVGALKAFPAYELVRVRERRMKRNWLARWKEHGGKTYGGRMIALKTDPIWSAISTFGTPYPPFDWNSGMGLADVSRRDCIDLGVIEPDAPPQTPPTLDFNGNLSANVQVGHWSTELVNFLQEKFGDQLIAVQNQKTGIVSVNWARTRLHEMFDTPYSDELKDVKWKLGKASEKLLTECDKAGPGLRKILEGRGLSLDLSLARHTIREGHWLVDKDRRNMPVTHADLDLVPILWREPDRVEPGGKKNSIVLCVDTFDGGTLKMPIATKGMATFSTGVYKKRGS